MMTINESYKKLLVRFSTLIAFLIFIFPINIYAQQEDIDWVVGPQIVDLGDNLSREATKDSPAYYFRPYKTMLVRSVSEHGKSYYVKGNHTDTLPALYKQLIVEK